MSILAELTRPYWLAGMHAVAGRKSRGLAAWIGDESFQVYTPIAKEAAVLSFTDSSSVVAAFAGDCTRMVSAALESAIDVDPSERLPRSVGWQIIRVYYSAFFAAHAILRMLGYSLSQLEAVHARSVTDIADLFSMSNGVTLAKGFYTIRCDTTAKTLALTKSVSTDGSHGAMWRVLHDVLTEVTNALLAGTAPSTPVQQVAAKLTEVQSALSYGSNAGRGSWLSEVRNRTNYRHEYGAWHPYTDRFEYYDRLHTIFRQWQGDPMSINLWGQPGRDLQRFAEVSAFIVGLCRVMSEDMARRCTKGTSFHRTGGLAILSLV
jgi:hypothetical protein